MLQALRFLISWFAPTIDSLFQPRISWKYRWRLLGLQPLALLTYTLKYSPYAFSRRYNVIEIPTRGRHTVRALLFQPKKVVRLSRLHIDFHGGAFVGGIAEYDLPFCELVSDRVGAVVLSAQYRSAPAHLYPCAHEDAEDVMSWVLLNAKMLWNADPDSLTVSGSSAGGNLMFTAGSRAKAAVGFCPAVDLRVPPWQKPKPQGFPKYDPLSWLLPLFDAYAGGSASLQRQRAHDSRLSPILKRPDELPGNVLFIVAGIDILAQEEMAFIERLKADVAEDERSDHRVVDSIVFEKGFHGWLELPDFIIGKQGVRDRDQAYNAALKFLSNAPSSYPAIKSIEAESHGLQEVKH